MPTDFETFLASFCIWVFQDKCSSSITPKNRTSFTRSISISLIEKCKSSFCLFCFVSNRIKFDFFYVNRKLISLKPAYSLFNSLLTISISWFWSLWEKNMLVSSAKSMKSKAFNTLDKSLMYNKNNYGPKIDPWGTPHLTYFRGRIIAIVLYKLSTTRNRTFDIA